MDRFFILKLNFVVCLKIVNETLGFRSGLLPPWGSVWQGVEEMKRKDRRWCAHVVRLKVELSKKAIP